MGCVSSKYDYIPEELEVLVNEIRLPYNTHPPLKIDLVHRKYSYMGKVNKSQWEEIKNVLNFQNLDPSTNALFDSFLNDGVYLLRGLLLLGVLLSYGSFTDKAQLLFEIADIENTRFVKKQKIEELVDELLDISIHKSALLLKKPSIRIKKYLKDLEVHKEQGKKLMMSHFFSTSASEICQEDFINHFYKSSAARLLTASGIRKFIYQSFN